MITRFIVFVFVSLLYSSFSFAQGIKGTIKSSRDGQPLIGVSVQVKGTSLGNATDENGTYEIFPVEKGIKTLIFSCIGMKTVEKKSWSRIEEWDI